MKITEIKRLERKSDNKEYWRVELEGEEIPLLVFSKPDFAEGTDLSKDNLRVAGEGKYYTLLKKDGKPAWKPQGKSPEEIFSIERQVILKSTVDIYNHCTDPNVPFDKVILSNIHKVVKSLLDGNPLVDEIKKAGGKETK